MSLSQCWRKIPGVEAGPSGLCSAVSFGHCLRSLPSTSTQCQGPTSSTCCESSSPFALHYDLVSYHIEGREGEPIGRKMSSPSHIKSLNSFSTSSFMVTMKEGALLLLQECCEIEQNVPCALGRILLWPPENFTPLISHQHGSVWHPVPHPYTNIAINLPLQGRGLSLLGPNALVCSMCKTFPSIPTQHIPLLVLSLTFPFPRWLSSYKVESDYAVSTSMTPIWLPPPKCRVTTCLCVVKGRSNWKCLKAINLTSTLFLRSFHLLAFLKPSSFGFAFSLPPVHSPTAMMVSRVNYIPVQIFRRPLKISWASKLCPSLWGSLPSCHYFFHLQECGISPASRSCHILFPLSGIFFFPAPRLFT